MSELKAYKPYANRDGDVLIYHKGDGDLMLDDEDEIYLKEDADKVIADLEESHKMEVEQLLMEIVELKADYKEACDRLQTANLIKDEQLAATRHHKYKRCLAMAWWCEATALWCYQAANTLPAGFHATLYGKPVMIEPSRLFKRFELLSKWNKRWLELAEKFKEAK